MTDRRPPAAANGKIRITVPPLAGRIRSAETRARNFQAAQRRAPSTNHSPSNDGRLSTGFEDGSGGAGRRADALVVTIARNSCHKTLKTWIQRPGPLPRPDPGSGPGMSTGASARTQDAPQNMRQIPSPSLRAEGEAIHAAVRGGGMDCFVPAGSSTRGSLLAMTVVGRWNRFSRFGASPKRPHSLPSTGSGRGSGYGGSAGSQRIEMARISLKTLETDAKMAGPTLSPTGGSG